MCVTPNIMFSTGSLNISGNVCVSVSVSLHENKEETCRGSVPSTLLRTQAAATIETTHWRVTQLRRQVTLEEQIKRERDARGQTETDSER